MISFFPDLNVWIALSVSKHQHNADAFRWLDHQPKDARLIFSRYTHVGLLRLLTNASVMGGQVLTLKHAWQIYDNWLGDPRIHFHPEPQELDTAFREVTSPLGARHASNWIGDCYLLAYAKSCNATLVTFDKALIDYARKQGCRAVLPG